MQSGSSVYRRIEQQVATAQQRLDHATRQVERLRSDQAANRSQETRLLAELARVRLGELDGDRVRERLDHSDREALEMLAERDRELARLQQVAHEGARQLAALGAEQDRAVAAREAANAAREACIAATMQRLAGDDDWAAQRGHVEFTAQKAARAAEKAQLAAEDRDRKRQPFERDKLFAYLWRRRYRFPEYRAMPLFATLDGWVAGLCDYDRAHRDYALLLEIPKRLASHAAALADEAKAELERLAALERQALDADGEPALRAALEAAQQQVEALERRILAAETQQDEVLQQQSAMASGQDRWSSQAEQTVLAQLASEDVATLRMDALATPTARDDELVLRIAAARERADALGAELRGAEQEHQAALQTFREIEDVSRRFRHHDYHRSDSLFESDFDIGDLLTGVLRGVMRSGDAFSAVRRRQRWRSRPSSDVSSTLNTIGTIARIGGAILSASSRGGRSGGFGGGGGGFRSGGGFGGGGGFRTGGGF